MADAGERDVRDRLAEALWIGGNRGVNQWCEWDEVHSLTRKRLFADADWLLSALPTVGLRIGRVEE